MNKLARLFFVGGLFLFIDQILKYFSRTLWQQKHLLFNFFGWYPFKNFGAAFGIPLPIITIIIPSTIIITLIIYILINSKINLLKQFGLILIITGAISNLVDRIFLGYTVDYLLIFAGVINLADIMIVFGFILYLITYKKEGYVSQT